MHTNIHVKGGSCSTKEASTSIYVGKDVPSLSCKDAHGLEIHCFPGNVQLNMKDVMMYFEHHLSGSQLLLQIHVSNDVDLQPR